MSFLVINGNVLVYFKGPNDSSPQGEIRKDDSRIRDMRKDFKFQIETSDRVYWLQAASEKEKDKWIDTLRKAQVEFLRKVAMAASSPNAEKANQQKRVQMASSTVGGDVQVWDIVNVPH